MARKPLVLRDRVTKVLIPYYVKGKDVLLNDGTSLEAKLEELDEADGSTIKQVTFNNGEPIRPDENGNVVIQQEQSDWEENDPLSPKHIPHKPDIVNDVFYEEQTRTIKKCRNGVISEVVTLPEGGSTGQDIIDAEAIRLNRFIRIQNVSIQVGDYDDAAALMITRPVGPGVRTITIPLISSGVVMTKQEADSKYFGRVAYDSLTHHINFYGSDDVENSNVLGYLDASPFILDGMLNNVEVKNVSISGVSTLCIAFTFNTDSGKQDINIPVSSIFNAANYYLKTEVDNLLSEKANAADVYDKQTVDQKVANAGKVKSVTINGKKKLPDEETGDVDLGEVQGGSGITPHIDVVTGHWFIGGEDTGIDAHGLQGNSGYTGAVGELEVVEDYTEGGVGKAASAEAVKNMAIKSIPDAGTFGDAYDKAKANNMVFPWLLRDVDKDGNSVTKMIWHVGNRDFVDAIGAKIDGVKNGLTITTVKPCYMKIWEQGPGDKADSASVTKTYPLLTGENNFGFEEVGSTFFFMNFFSDAEATTEVKDAVESVDFGGMVCTCAQAMPNYPTTPGYNLLNSQTALLSVRRLVFAAEDAANLRGGVIGLCSYCANLESFSASGSIKLGDNPYSYGFSILANTPKLANLDIKDLEIEDAKSLGGFTDFGNLQTLDIRGLSFTGGSVDSFVRNCTSIKTLIIGNLDEPESGFNQYYRTSLDRIVCTTQTPPTLQVYESGSNKDWVRNYLNQSTGVILVPPGCGNTYKQASGWSVYADKISEYNEGDY